jgi:hypothetical protein
MDCREIGEEVIQPVPRFEVLKERPYGDPSPSEDGYSSENPRGALDLVFPTRVLVLHMGIITKNWTQKSACDEE